MKDDVRPKTADVVRQKTGEVARMLASLLVGLVIGGSFFEWAWYDWLGLVAVLLVLGLLYVARAAIKAGESPLQVLVVLKDAFLEAIRRRPN